MPNAKCAPISGEVVVVHRLAQDEQMVLLLSAWMLVDALIKLYEVILAPLVVIYSEAAGVATETAQGARDVVSNFATGRNIFGQAETSQNNAIQNFFRFLFAQPTVSTTPQ